MAARKKHKSRSKSAIKARARRERKRVYDSMEHALAIAIKRLQRHEKRAPGGILAKAYTITVAALESVEILGKKRKKGERKKH